MPGGWRLERRGDVVEWYKATQIMHSHVAQSIEWKRSIFEFLSTMRKGARTGVGEGGCYHKMLGNNRNHRILIFIQEGKIVAHQHF